MDKPAEIDVWTIHLDKEVDLGLSPDECERASRLRFEEDRIRWSRSRSALRRILASYVLRNPAELVFDLGEHGKPALRGEPDVHFNLSHSGHLALIAVARVAPVGIDVERIRERVDIGALLMRLGETDLPDGRVALFQRWVRREAHSKAAGGPLLRPPAADVQLFDLQLEAGYVGAVAVMGRQSAVRHPFIHMVPQIKMRQFRKTTV